MDVNVHQCTRMEVTSHTNDNDPVPRTIYWLDIKLTEKRADGPRESGLCVFFKDELYCRKLAHAINQVNAEYWGKAPQEVEDGTLA